MDQVARVRMAALGVAAALAVYGLIQLGDSQILQDRALLALTTFLGTFFIVVMLTCGPVSLRSAGKGGALFAVAITVLIQVCALHFGTIAQMGAATWPLLAGLVLVSLPLPFWIAHQRGQWRDYDVLFSEAWAIVLRAGIATLFTCLVWLLIYLFDLLLSLVGVTVIASLLEFEIVPYLITGGLFGLGLAVVHELSDVIGPNLVLRLLRLLLPITLIVVVVFLLAVPLNGFSNLFDGWSVGLTMLSIVAVGATLITSVVDQRDEAASKNRLLQGATRILAGLLVIVAALGAVAIYLRARQYGWTPDRVFAAMIAGLALGYGVQYAVACLRPRDWMARIRRANVNMAVGAIALAAISLTPILNAERISANSQLAQRDVLPDLAALNTWGYAGQEALSKLTARSKESGQETLAAHLAGYEQGIPAARSIADLIPLLPVSPKGADAAEFLTQLEPYLIDVVTKACQSDMPTGGKGCVMVVADFLPNLRGDEAGLFFLNDTYLNVISLSQYQFQPTVDWRMLTGSLPSGEPAEALIRQLQNNPPSLQPAPIMKLSLGDGRELVFLPPQVN